MVEGAPSVAGFELRVIPPLHIITDDAILLRPDLLGVAGDLLRAGGERVAFHLRGPNQTGRTLFRLAEALLSVAKEAGGTLLVNDRLDVVLSLDLPGAHLGQRSLPPAASRGLLGPSRLLGLSVHGTQEAVEAKRGMVDFVVVGAVYSTASHPGVVPGGAELIREIGALDPPPLVGIGGVTPARVAEVLAAGAQGVAVRGGLWDAPDPVQALGDYLDGLGRSPLRSAGPTQEVEPGKDLRTNP